MAVNEIQVGRQNAVLHKLLAMKEGSPSPLLAPEIIPVLALESDRPEWAFLAGEFLAWGFAEPSAVVGQFGYVELSNPTGSGTLCIVEQIVLASGATQITFAVGVGTYAPLVGAVSGIARDTRGLPGSPSCGLRSTTSAAGIGGINGWKFSSDAQAAPVLVSLPIVLEPGSLLAVQAIDTNKAIRISIAWRERTLEPSETR